MTLTYILNIYMYYIAVALFRSIYKEALTIVSINSEILYPVFKLFSCTIWEHATSHKCQHYRYELFM